LGVGVARVLNLDLLRRTVSRAEFLAQPVSLSFLSSNTRKLDFVDPRRKLTEVLFLGNFHWTVLQASLVSYKT
jgi:hypothetical protein